MVCQYQISLTLSTSSSLFPNNKLSSTPSVSSTPPPPNPPLHHYYPRPPSSSHITTAMHKLEPTTLHLNEPDGTIILFLLPPSPPLPFLADISLFLELKASSILISRFLFFVYWFIIVFYCNPYTFELHFT